MTLAKVIDFDSAKGLAWARVVCLAPTCEWRLDRSAVTDSVSPLELRHWLEGLQQCPVCGSSHIGKTSISVAEHNQCKLSAVRIRCLGCGSFASRSWHDGFYSPSSLLQWLRAHDFGCLLCGSRLLEIHTESIDAPAP